MWRLWIQEVHFYIDQEGNGFYCVDHTEGFDELGVIFIYTSYVRMLKASLPTLMDFYIRTSNMSVKNCWCQSFKKTESRQQ